MDFLEVNKIWMYGKRLLQNGLTWNLWSTSNVQMINLKEDYLKEVRLVEGQTTIKNQLWKGSKSLISRVSLYVITIKNLENFIGLMQQEKFKR